MDLQSWKLLGYPSQIGSKSIDCQYSGVVFQNGDKITLGSRDLPVDEALF